MSINQINKYQGLQSDRLTLEQLIVKCNDTNNNLKVYPEHTYAEEIIKNLKLIIESGDSNIIECYWFKIDDIEFILIGEYHNHTIEQGDKESFFNILKKIIDDCPTDIDLFIEEFNMYKELMLQKKDQEYQYERDFLIIDNIRFLSAQRNDKCDKIKIHACDIRNSGLMTLLITYYEQFVKLGTPGFRELNESILEIFDSHYGYVKYFIKKQLKKISSDIVRTKYETFKKNLNFEMNNIDQYISENLDKFLSHEFLRIMSLSIDPYIILRMMKDYNSKIRIAYFGSNHIKNIYDNFFSKFENIEIKYQYIEPPKM